jgi:hypothetical protein
MSPEYATDRYLYNIALRSEITVWLSHRSKSILESLKMSCGTQWSQNSVEQFQCLTKPFQNDSTTYNTSYPVV